MSFYQDFKELIFSSLTEFSQQVLELQYHIKNRVFKSASLEFLKKDFLEFSISILSSFLTQA